MARQVSMQTRDELIAIVGERYRSAGRAARSRMLDEFVATTGYHRKHAIRLLARPAPPGSPRRRARPRQYGEDVREALVVLWEASDRICSKRLRPLIPVLLPALERHGKLTLGEEVRARLLAISSATIDRALVDVRVAAGAGRARRAGFTSAVRRAVPIRTFADWGSPEPGFVEADFVAHGGASSSGSFIQTLVLTDVATGWTECVPVLLRESALVIDALRIAEGLFPFPLRGIDFDNDSAFMNEFVVAWCRQRGLEVTRSRAYKKNDQAFVEQKNGALVRRHVGYGRFEGMPALQVLSRLYAAVRLQANLLQPSFKLKEKTRVGARVIKTYHPPASPAARLLGHPGIAEAARSAVTAMVSRLDPVVVLAEIRAAQDELGRRMGRGGRYAAPAEPIQVDLEAFARGLRTAWREGEQRPIHRRPYRRTKPAPMKPSMMDAFADQVRAWLEAQPALSAQEVLARLTAEAPDRFSALQLRTVQRTVKRWRGELAQRVLRGEMQPLAHAAPVATGAACATSSAASRARSR